MEIQHPSHEHPLTLCDDNAPPPPGSFQCGGCDQPFTGNPIYVCGECKFYLHKSCAGLTLQPQIHHPLHPLHPLTLNFDRTEGWESRPVEGCKCCRKSELQIYTYRCHRCGYLLCEECASLNMTPILKLQDRKHLLLLLEKVGFFHSLQCKVCLDDLGGANSNSPVFVCIIPGCWYYLHLHCFPLRIPQEVRHTCHDSHDLIYTEDVVECCYSAECYYCDVCEETRDPRFPVYACKDCGFSAHVYCSVAEMLPSLVEEYENDLSERGVFRDAFIHYFEKEIPKIQAIIEEHAAKLKGTEEEIQKLEISLRDWFLAKD